MRIIVQALLLFSFVITGCGESSNNSSSDTFAVEDATSIIARGDGTYDVLCRDGRREVVTANDIRANRVCVGGSGGGSSDIICVARDNDNAAPWVFAQFTDTGAIVKIDGISFSTLQNCNQSLGDGVLIGRSTYICIARDNDNAAPWIRAVIVNGSVTRQTTTTFSTYDQCRQSTVDGRSFGDARISCVARDNDNAAPWIFSLFSERGDQRISAPTFSTLPSCNDTYNRGRITSTSLLMCVARDNDNAAPWIIGSLSTNGTYTPNTGTTFSSVEECRQRLGQ